MNKWGKWNTKLQRDEDGVLLKEGIANIQSIRCKTCGHVQMSHLASCFVKGCKCIGYKKEEE